MARKVKLKFKDFKKFQKDIQKVLVTDKAFPKNVERIIRSRITKGISPVRGQGRFKGYSQSYKDQIQNRAAYRTINGRVVRFGVSKTGSRAYRGGQRDKLTDLNEHVLKYGKRVRPVNMTLSGKMMKGFYVERSSAGRLRIGFKGEHAKLADIHNSFGPGGKRQYIRRLLPTIPGEKFTRSVENEIIDEVKDIIRTPRFVRYIKNYFKGRTS
jgi:hypothetical protein